MIRWAAVLSLATVACGPPRTPEFSPNGSVCYSLQFGTWHSTDTSRSALAAVKLVSPLPDTVWVERRVATRDTIHARLISTSGWVLLLRLVGSLETRVGDAWLAQPGGVTDLGGATPAASLRAPGVTCSWAAIRLTVERE